MSLRLAIVLLIAWVTPRAHAADDIPWRFHSNGERVVAVGDIHGDLGALLKILFSKNLIDSAGHWVGGKAHLVMIGDLVDRGPDSIAVSEFVRQLSDQADKVGGHLHALFGNHESMYLDEAITADGRSELSKIAKGAAAKAVEGTTLHTATEGTHLTRGRLLFSDSEFAKWYASRNTIVQIDDKIFVHAGFEGWGAQADFGEINRRVREWIHYGQTGKNKPAQSSAWIVDEHGPLWTRVFNLKTKPADALAQLSSGDLDKILSEHKATQIVIGHNPNTEIILKHPVYGKRVVMIDSSISRAMGGHLTALEFDHGVAKAETYTRNRLAAGLETFRDQLLYKLGTVVGCANILAAIK